ncbi:unnamed protein product, partial [Ixodes persulcatus]
KGEKSRAQNKKNKIRQNYGPQSRSPPAHRGTCERPLVRIQQKLLYCSDDKRRTLPSPRLRCVFPRSTQTPMLL